MISDSKPKIGAASYDNRPCHYCGGPTKRGMLKNIKIENKTYPFKVKNKTTQICVNDCRGKNE